MAERIPSPFSREELIPKAEMLEKQFKKGSLAIGLPKETNLQERCLCLTPDAVSVLVANGHKVIVENGAGENANYSNERYSEAGAKIAYDPKEVYAQPFVLKVQPPNEKEIAMLEPNAVLLSSVLPNIQKREFFEQLASKKTTALGFGYIKDEEDRFPIIRILSEIAGLASILVASELMCTEKFGNGLLMGGITGVRPTEVVIIGGGTVGEFAIRSAMGMGASVRVFDKSLTRLRRLQNNLGSRVSTSFLDPKELQKALYRADVVVGAVRGNTRTPIVVSEEMVCKMKPGAIIVDVSISNGGCIETSEVTTHEYPTLIKHNIIHYAVPNITSKFPRTTTKALSNFFLMYLLYMSEAGGLSHLLSKDSGLRNGVYMYKGRMTNRQLSAWFDFPDHDINLLIVSQ